MIVISAREYSADVLVKTIIVEYSPGDSGIRVDYITSGRLMFQGTLLGEFCGPVTGLVESV